MGFLGKFMEGFHFNSEEADDDYFLDEDYEDEDYEEEGRPAHAARRSAPAERSAAPKSGGFLGRSKVVPIDTSAMEVTMLKPSSMEDAKEICNYLLAGKAVVLNMDGIHTETAQRIIDFTLGVIYAIDGDLQSISKFIFIASPRNVELSGAFQSDVDNMISNNTVKTQGTGGFMFNA